MQGLAAVSLGRRLLKTLTAFGEVIFASRAGVTGASAGADAGLTWVVHRRVALDAAVETLLAGRRPDFGLRIGATLLVGP